MWVQEHTSKKAHVQKRLKYVFKYDNHSTLTSQHNRDGMGEGGYACLFIKHKNPHFDNE